MKSSPDAAYRSGGTMMQTGGKERGWSLMAIAMAVCFIVIGPVRASAEQIIVKM
jgi:hypothetical protein